MALPSLLILKGGWSSRQQERGTEPLTARRVSATPRLELNMNPQPRTPEIELPHLRISLFGDCNFRCVYCPPWGENSYAIQKNLDTDSLKRVLSKLRVA